MAYAATCRDRTRVWTDSGSVHFDADVPIPVGGNPLFLVAVSGAFGHLAMIKAGTGRASLIDRASRNVTDLGPTHGNYCVGLRDDGTPVWQDSTTTFRVGAVSHPIPDLYRGTSQGFLALDPLGFPVWTDAQHRHPIVVGGQTLGLASRDGVWTVGQATDGTPDFLAYHHGQGILYRAGPTLGSPIAPRITTHEDGTATLARSIPIGWLPSSGFTVYTPPPVRIPTFVPIDFPIGVLIYDHPDREIIDATETATARTGAVLYAAQQATPTRAQSRAAAQAIGRYPLYFLDRHGLRPDHVPAGFLGLVAAYGSASRTVASTLALIRADLIAFRDAQVPCAINLGLARQVNVLPNGTVVYALSEQKVLDVFSGAVRLAAEFRVQLRCVYTKSRGTPATGVIDGLDHYASFRQALANMEASAPQSDAIPLPPAPTPPNPEPPDPVEPDMPCVIDTYTYAQWLDLGAKIDARYREISGTGQPPAGTDVQHNTWRVLKEGMSEAEMLARMDPNFP